MRETYGGYGDTWGGGVGKVCELGLRSGPPYLSGEMPSGAKGSPLGRCSPSGPGSVAGPRLLLPLPASMPVGGTAVRALVLKRWQRRRLAPAHASARVGQIAGRGRQGAQPMGGALEGRGQRFVAARLPSAGGLLSSRPRDLPRPGLRAFRSPAGWL